MTFAPITLGSGLAGYNYISRTRDTQQALFDRNPLTAREVAIVTEKMKDVKTSDDLMSDRTLLKVALGAFGLDEDIDNRAFIKKILDSDLSDRQSLANKISDKRYLALAKSFNFQSADGPQLPDSRGASELTEKMESLQTADDLLSDASLLRAALEEFGLESNLGNTYFLEQVLNSDLSDPESFANRMGDERLVDFAQAFNFFQKAANAEESKSRILEIFDTFTVPLGDVESAEDLLAQPELVEETLRIFGLADIYTADFLSDVLNSDLNDSASLANTQSDDRFAALAAAFNFATPRLDADGAPIVDEMGDPVRKPGTLEVFLATVALSPDMPETPEDFLANRPLRDVTFELLGLPQTTAARGLAERVLSSDKEDPASFANTFPDSKYAALSDLLDFEPPQPEQGYPEGFVDQVVRNYLDRQFEIQVGESDPDMRIALSLERELNQLVRTSGSNDAQWFSIMSSPPLRKVFEGAFRLPSSFGSIDIDQQFLVLKDRAEQFFGTTTVEDFLETDRMAELRRNYLVSRSTEVIGTTSSANIASIILSNL